MMLGWFRYLTVLVLALALGPAGCLSCCLPVERPAQSTGHSCCDPQEQPSPAQAGAPDTQSVCHLPPSGLAKQDTSSVNPVAVALAFPTLAVPAASADDAADVPAASSSPPSTATPLVLRI